jgi:glutathione S-transferase
MKLYGVPLSVHTRKVQLALREKGIEHGLEVVIPIAPETFPGNWADLSPTGLIPVLEDGDFTLPDSAAIIQYLDTRYPEVPIIPADARERGRAVWIEAYMGGFFREILHPVFHQRVTAPRHSRAPDTVVTTRALTILAPRYLQYLDRISGPGWLVGKTFSLADIAIGANLVLFHYLGEAVSQAEYPSLRAYFRRLLGTPAFRLQLLAEQPFAEQMGLSQEGLLG